MHHTAHEHAARAGWEFPRDAGYDEADAVQTQYEGFALFA